MIKPFLQWPGGKAKVVPFILPHLGLPCRRFVEPFCGACSVSLAVAESGGAGVIWCNDINGDLINLLEWAARAPDRLPIWAKPFFKEGNRPDYYYALRNEFNERHGMSSIQQAARFLYLDFHCYNALIRYNKRGEFNSPFRKDRKIAAFPEQAIRDFARLMESTPFTSMDFEEVMARAGFGDVVYCDPPYLPLSKTANFTTYSAGGFSWADQERLAKAAQAAADRGARVVISQANVPAAHGLYAGAEIHEIEVHRSISCKASSRGKAKEIIAVYYPRAAEKAG